MNMLFRYLQYCFRAKTKYAIHSPFVYDLITNILQDEREYNAYQRVEKLKKEFKKDKQWIEMVDCGTGFARKRRIKNIAKTVTVSTKYARLLFRLVKYFKAKNMLELGTSLGFSAIYQALANDEIEFMTIEGCPNTAKIAENNLKKTGIDKVKVINGNFDIVLPEVLKQFVQLDHVFFDGNHRKESVLSYFHTCLPLVHNNTLFIFDDIHWSKEMEEAWKEIKNHPQVTITIDLFFMGLVFFRKEQSKEDFVIRF